MEILEMNLDAHPDCVDLLKDTPFEPPSKQTASSSLTVSRLVGWMVDWLVWLVVIGGWRRQIILSYKITNNIIGVLRANSLVAPWPGVCIVYRTSQHDRCGAPPGSIWFCFCVS